MKLQYFFGCILAAASLAVWPEIGLAHGGGGHGGGGGGHGFGGGGHAFVGGGHGFGGGGHALGRFTARRFSPGFSGTREFSTGRFSGRGDHGRFGDRGFRGRDRDFRDRRFRDFDEGFSDFGFYGLGYPDYYRYNYPYDYAYPYYKSSKQIIRTSWETANDAGCARTLSDREHSRNRLESNVHAA
jgi:hypothetical protein